MGIPGSKSSTTSVVHFLWPQKQIERGKWHLNPLLLSQILPLQEISLFICLIHWPFQVDPTMGQWWRAVAIQKCGPTYPGYDSWVFLKTKTSGDLKPRSFALQITSCVPRVFSSLYKNLGSWEVLAVPLSSWQHDNHPNLLIPFGLLITGPIVLTYRSYVCLLDHYGRKGQGYFHHLSLP